MPPELQFKPLTAKLWNDFESLFGERGACGGCWCMWFRLSNRMFQAGKGESNRAAMRSLVEAGQAPGLLAYRDGRAVGWCAVAPREEYIRLRNSRILKPIDEEPVWSIVCLFIEKRERGNGIAVELLCAAVDFVRKRGGKIVEGYAVEPKEERMPAVFAYHGPTAAYLQAGFREVARRSPRRPIMRCYMDR